MNSSRGILGLFLLLCILPALRCTGPQRLAGNSSQTPNALVGTLYEPDGTTPAKAVRVNIRPKSFLVAISEIALSRQSADTVSAATDESGRFAFDTSLNPGTYVIEAQSGPNAVFIDSIAIVDKYTTDTLAPAVLKPVGAITGIIRLSEGGDPRKVFVLVFGLDRFATVKADGRFYFERLAEGNYTVMILPTLDDYDVLDTIHAAVKSADTNDIGVIEPPYNGIPTVKNVAISYDTLKQWVTLRWSRPGATIVKSFNMYRRTFDPMSAIFSQLNFSPISDTVFIDSICEQNKTYEYRITAVDSTANEGDRSAPTQARIALYDITPKSIAMIYDTIKQTIMLHWSNPDTALVNGYNIYRRNVDLNEAFWTPFNKSPVLDTSFIDSMFNICPNYSFTPSGSMDNREPMYEYCVGALIKNVREGVRSAAVSARISLKYITPVHVQCQYDTARKAVRLGWNVPDATLVTGFYVFRKNLDKNNDAFAQMNHEALGDTVYCDSTSANDQTYEYRVASIIDGRAEVKSEGAQVRIPAEE